MTTTRYAMMATAMKTCKTNVVHLRNRQIHREFTVIPYSENTYLAVIMVVAVIDSNPNTSAGKDGAQSPYWILYEVVLSSKVFLSTSNHAVPRRNSYNLRFFKWWFLTLTKTMFWNRLT